MAWRSLFISNPAKLKTKNEQLVIIQEDEISIPLEDISVIVIENNQVLATTKLLSKLSENKVAVYFCNSKHIPNGILLPFQSHSRQNKVLNMQINLSKPFVNRCWQQIVKSKINNQALCLQILNKDKHYQLLKILKTVQSGDKTNREAYAATIYFNSLFENFTRQQDNNINYALNYGYSILRGAIARTLVVYGFMPSLGIHHNSELNNFNLADDFIEPFRPLVDLWVGSNIEINADFGKKERIELVNLLNYDVLIDGNKQKVLRAINICISSFVRACSNKDYKYLLLPTLIPLKEHEYE